MTTLEYIEFISKNPYNTNYKLPEEKVFYKSIREAISDSHTDDLKRIATPKEILEVIL